MNKLTSKIGNRFDQYRLLDARDKRKFWVDFFLNNAIYIILVLLIIYVQYYSINVIHARNSFLSFNSIVDILKKSAAALFLALGVG